MLDVEIVVAGGVGDLLVSMLGDFAVERRPASTVLVAGQTTLLTLLDRLAAVDAEVLSIVAVPTPAG